MKYKTVEQGHLDVSKAAGWALIAAIIEQVATHMNMSSKLVNTSDARLTCSLKDSRKDQTTLTKTNSPRQLSKLKSDL